MVSVDEEERVVETPELRNFGHHGHEPIEDPGHGGVHRLDRVAIRTHWIDYVLVPVE